MRHISGGEEFRPRGGLLPKKGSKGHWKNSLGGDRCLHMWKPPPYEHPIPRVDPDHPSTQSATSQVCFAPPYPLAPRLSHHPRLRGLSTLDETFGASWCHLTLKCTRCTQLPHSFCAIFASERPCPNRPHVCAPRLQSLSSRSEQMPTLATTTPRLVGSS